MTALLNSGCDKAIFGWPCDEEMEKLRDAFTRETDPVKQKAIAEAVQNRDEIRFTGIGGEEADSSGRRNTLMKDSKAAFGSVWAGAIVVARSTLRGRTR